jgi:hypothetical protein
MARWFMLSYDAAEEMYELLTEANNVTRGTRRIRYSHLDFRKTIIRILRTKNVTAMREPVKTTIIFHDPSKVDIVAIIAYWENSLRHLGDEFRFVIGALAQHDNGTPILREFADEQLNTNFQQLLREVLQEERERLTR